MKCIYFLSLVLAVAIAEEKYRVKLENFNAENVVADKATLLSYLQCFIDENPCVGNAAALKPNARNVVETGCSVCTDDEKHFTKLFLESSAKDLPEDYERFKKFFDPSGTLLPALAQNIANY